MIQCQNCGRVNNYGSNFCRFCGTKFLVNQIAPSNRQAAEAENFEPPPPRPYSWKTDEFQISADALTNLKNRQVKRVQPLGNQNQGFYPQPQQPLAYQKPPVQNLAYNQHCPRCASQAFKFERKISNAGWITFAVLLVMFFPLFWIGFLIKEDVRVCQICGYKLV